MIWWSKRFLPSRRGGALVVVAALLMTLLPAWAQKKEKQDFQERLDNAHKLFNQGKVEDACELLQQLAREKPDDKEVQALLNPACVSTKNMYDMEEKLFNDAERLFQQGLLDDAKQKYEQAARQPLKKPKYRNQVAARLKDMDAKLAAAKQAAAEREKQAAAEREKQLAAEREKQAALEREKQAALEREKQAAQEREKQAALDREKQAALDREKQAAAGREKQAAAEREKQAAAERAKSEAEKARRASEIAAMDPRQAAVALIADARTAMSRADYRAASEELQTALKINPKNAEAPQLLEKVKQGLVEQPLRNGLAAYFAGKYDEAERYLSEYISAGNDSRRGLAYFFRGASHSARFYLSGERDSKQKSLALVDFRSARFYLSGERDKQKSLREKLVPPKVLNLYAESAASGS